jgi:hypothetical protein
MASVALYEESMQHRRGKSSQLPRAVEATTAIRQAEVGAAETMLDRTAEQFDVTPSRLVADAGYGSAEMV